MSLSFAKIQEIDDKNFVKSIVTFVLLIFSTVFLLWILGIKVELINSEVYLVKKYESINGTIISESKVN